jgi:beta-glucosidase
MGRVHLEKGEKASLEIMYGQRKGDKIMAKLIWAKVNAAADPAALEAARKADVVIAVVGITSQLEGEEMPVSEPGFLGGDRTSIDLPQPEEDLVQSVAKAGKPLVVVLMNGSALAVNWEKEHANAIVDAWYSGEEGGTAIAETLSGKNNPAGRLPVTFYTGVEQLPHFEDYSMNNRTYRYFKGKPLFPFGYGLSYTTFAYKDLTLPTEPVDPSKPLSAEATVTNTGKVAGDEVAELYLSFPPVAGAPIRALRAFQRVHLEPGQSQQVHFELKPRDMSMVTEAGDPIVPQGEFKVSVGGGQPDTGAPTVTGTFKVGTSLMLPE